MFNDLDFDKVLEEERIQSDPQEKNPVFQCDFCGRDMHKNERYYEFHGFDLCEDCLDEEQRKEKDEAEKYVGEDYE